MKKVCIGLVAIWAGVFLFAPFASATAVPPGTPPSPTAYYYGDADGDTLLTTFDLGILNNIFNGQSYTFFTLQPDNPNDDWNTADIDSDDLLTTFDLGYYSQYFNGQTLDLPDKPWIIEGINLHASYTTTGVFFPFNGNVSAYNGDRGRAGVAVVAEILPVGSGSTTTGSLSGRDCAAIDMFDLADPGAQCALAVTITDWQTDLILGLTEDGTYGLEVMADSAGTIAIQLSVSDNGLGIEVPTISTTIYTRIYEVNQNPTITVDCPQAAFQNVVTYCALTASDPDIPSQALSCNVDPATTCTNVSLLGCNWVHLPAQGSGSPPSCLVVVDVQDDFSPPGTGQGSDTIDIIPNSFPHITSTAPATAGEGILYNYDITAIEGIPPLTCLLVAGDTCGGSMSGANNCTYSYMPDYTMQSCAVGINVRDDSLPPNLADNGPQFTTITINRRPSVSLADCSGNGGEGIPYSCIATVFDPDIPAQTLMCSKTISDTCGGVLSGSDNCSYSFTPGVAVQSCVIGMQVVDNGTPGETSAPATRNVVINHRPAWQAPPSNITITSGSIYNTNNGRATDPDVGQTLTCSSGGTSCSGFTPTVTGSGASPLSCNVTFTAGWWQTCNLRIRVTDNGTPATSVGQTITITIPPRGATWLVAPSDITIISGSVYGPTVNGVLIDADIGKTLTCSTSATSCFGFSPTYTGSGTSPTNCTLAFTAGIPQTCDIRLTGTDNGAPASSVGTTITISVFSVWTWMSGSNSINQNGVYGAMGVPDPANIPGGRSYAVSWTDASGNFWLFGGYVEHVSCGGYCHLNDLWRWDGVNWTWMSGSNAYNQAGIYGIKGVPDPANVPRARDSAVSWTDTAGNLWLFGGGGVQGDLHLNDLWRWDGINWTWMSGSNASGQTGHYGTKGVTNPANVPGARYGSVSWTDASGNFWLFGGIGIPAIMSYGFLNDLWRWDGVNWTWMSGINTLNQLGVYGTKGLPAATNVPGARDYAVSWTDLSGNLWLFGGYGYPASGAKGYLNDLWRWDGANWTWMSGSDAAWQYGVYGAMGMPATGNVPGSRVCAAVSWTDLSGNLWLFGGQGYPESGSFGELNDLWRYNP